MAGPLRMLFMSLAVGAPCGKTKKCQTGRFITEPPVMLLADPRASLVARRSGQREFPTRSGRGQEETSVSRRACQTLAEDEEQPRRLTELLLDETSAPRWLLLVHTSNSDARGDRMATSTFLSSVASAGRGLARAPAQAMRRFPPGCRLLSVGWLDTPGRRTAESTTSSVHRGRHG
jgi:hypothetical protein